MAGYSAWNEPGTGSSQTGLSLVVQFSGGKLLQATVWNAQNMTPADLQAVLDAFAGIPGCTYATLSEGLVTERFMEPDRDYEPLPPPPEG